MSVILITGATGFLGGHLLRKIIDNTNYEIVVLKRSFSNTDRIDDILNNERISCYDIDKLDLETIFNENKIDFIIHCATDYGKRKSSIHDILITNLMFPIQLLELSIKFKVKIFMNTDSYFNKENLSYSYLMNYSLSKKSLNFWLKYFAQKLTIANMRLEHIYGEYDNSDKFVEAMIRKIAIDKAKSVDLSPGEQMRDFIYVDDVCEAYIQVLAKLIGSPACYEQFDIGTGVSTSIKEFVLKIRTLSKSKTRLNFSAFEYRNDEIMSTFADIKKINEFGYNPKTTVEEGLKKILAIYAKERFNG